MRGLRNRRRAVGLSQVELAALIGVAQSAVSEWESGKKLPRAAQLPALAAALHCSIDELYSSGEEDADLDRG